MSALAENSGWAEDGDCPDESLEIPSSKLQDIALDGKSDEGV